jgi:hypothetical protein
MVRFLREQGIIPSILIILIILSAIAVGYEGIKIISREKDSSPQEKIVASSPFIYSFNTKERLEEVGGESESISPYWWIDSGGFMDMDGEVGKTAQGSLPANDGWRLRYAKSNPEDTDGGYHPQNIFRLISKSVWENFREEVYFKIEKDELSQSPNRNESNGLLLFMRYIDSNNLYYTGLRVDGMAVIKKKLGGTYYILQETPVFSGRPYDRDVNPNLLPKNVWIGIRGEIMTLSDKTVSIKTYIDIGKTGVWKEILSAIDNGKNAGKPILDASPVGIRTDFMDVSFSKFKIEALRLE